jgi:4-hydroxy-2-oxoheptanedioate aldolase
MKYPSASWPSGIRGAGAMFAPAYFNQSGQDYLRHANDNILVIVQIESRKAVENCEEIAKTPGIGTFFCPPSGDLEIPHHVINS